MKWSLAIFQVSGSSAVVRRICQVKGNLVGAGSSIEDKSCLSLSWAVNHGAGVQNTMAKWHNGVSASWLHLWVLCQRELFTGLQPGELHHRRRLRALGDQHWAARAVPRVSSVQLQLWEGRLRCCRCGCKRSLGQADPSSPCRFTAARYPASAACWYTLCFGLHSWQMGLVLVRSSFTRCFWVPWRLWQDVCCPVTAETEWLHIPENAEGGFQNKVCSEEPSYLLYEHA